MLTGRKMLYVRTLSDTALATGTDRLRITVQSLSLEAEGNKSPEKLEKQKKEDSLKKTSIDQLDKPLQLKTISLDEVAWHDTENDCWLAIYDYVYDCTEFLKHHPGGVDILLEYAGRDATLAFIGTGHSKFAHKALEKYLLGELPSSERIFRIPGGVKVSGF